MVRVFWLLLLCLLPGAPDAALVVGPEHPERIDLRGHLGVLHDPAGSWTIEEVRARSATFRPVAVSRGGGLNFGYVRGAIWLRLPIRSSRTMPFHGQLELDYASLDRVSLFDGSGGVRSSGDRIPFGERATPHRNPVFSVVLAPGAEETWYLRIASEGSITVNPRLWTDAAFSRHSEQGYAMHALYFGMLVALAAYNLLLGLALRERVFLYYVLFVAGIGVGIASIYGLAGQYLWPDWVEWSNRALVSGFATAGIVGPLFTRDFLGTRAATPGWDRALLAGAAAHVLVLVFGLLAPMRAGMQLMSVSTLLNCLLMLGCGLACLWRGVPGARLFVLAWAFLLVGGILMALRNFGLLPTHFVTLHAMQLGSALEMLLLSFALADRFNHIRREHARAQADALAAQTELVHSLKRHERELEQRVAERTEALALANARLRELALRDPLTALANRAALYAHLLEALQRAGSGGPPVAVMMIDLDGFKAVNDRLGHETGDRLLMEVADRLRQVARPADLVARLGGDEFIVVAEGLADSRAVDTLAARLLATVTQPFACAPDARIGASIGVAVSADGGEDVDVLLRRVDRAMYAAKAAGKGTVQWATA